MTVRITPDPEFKRAAAKLPPDRRKAAIVCLGKFQREPQTPGLKFRKLESNPGHFIISSAHGDRIILKLIGPDEYAAIDVGPHDNVYRRWNR